MDSLPATSMSPKSQPFEEMLHPCSSIIPPPIPKRNFVSKIDDKNVEVSTEKCKLIKPCLESNNILKNVPLCYPNNIRNDAQNVIFKKYVRERESVNPSTFDDTNTCHIYNDCSTDAEGTSDEDRISLENSVFDESAASTPIKFGVKAVSKVSNEIGSTIKRKNRSSCSTVDSITTNSSGYGTHSERFASTSTTADNRSRLSSVDTQSSLDSCLADKPPEPFSMKDRQRFDRPNLNEFMNNLNNNKSQSGSQLPTVPIRKSNSKKICFKSEVQEPEQFLNNIVDGSSSKTSSTVTSSNSSSSTGSGTLSGSSMSISVTNSNATISPILINSQVSMIGQIHQHSTKQKRSSPPTPPLRTRQIIGSISCNVTHETSFKFPSFDGNVQNKSNAVKFGISKRNNQKETNVSAESASGNSSPGYNCKQNSMETLLSDNALRNNPSFNSNFASENSTNNYEYPISRLVNLKYIPTASSSRKKIDHRQSSSISNDSFGPTSSTRFNAKLMEAPLLPTINTKKSGKSPSIVLKHTLTNESLDEKDVNMSPLTKCVSTPASLQTIVRFQNGTQNTMSFPHQIINRRKSSNPYITNGRLKFRLFQILLNAFALLVIAGGLAAYFNAYPTIKFVNKTIINTIHVEDSFSFGKNPAPGTCLPIIVKFCQGPQIPYNYTVFPNYIGHFGQLETQSDLDAYEALVDVRCYELVSLFLCSLFVPKCGPTGATVPPCKTLCTETMRRCGFFFDVFGLSLPEYLNCKLFKDFESADDCVGLDEVREVMIAASNPTCDGFQCDHNRCIPKEYVCDGNLDCMDQADEASCKYCKSDEIYCGDTKCIGVRNICDGYIDCPFGQDERNCIRLSERNGDLGRGVLEVYRRTDNEWTPACVKYWDKAVSPSVVCSMLGYNSVNATNVVTQKTRRPMLSFVNASMNMWKLYSRKRSKMMQEFSNCNVTEDYPIAELTCTNFGCGKVKRGRRTPSRRIIGGSRADPGSWPFLAAILGGPEKIFYCAGVLISDQWVLTASHCIGNHTVIDLEDWTIQLGVTRRDSFTYTGQEVKVKTVVPHPQYNMIIAHDNDIALFQLVKRVKFHEHLLPVCLPPPNLKQLKIGQMCTVIGWGKREDKDPKSTYEPIINEVQVPIIKHSQCDEWFENLTVTEGMICAGYEEGGKDACQGDSGGPLVCPLPGEKDRWFVGGIVSWGIQCANPKLPGVYANVIKYVPWIQEQMQKYSKPFIDENISKYDNHPGGPDILSNLANTPFKTNKPHYIKNRGPEEID